MEQPSTAHQIEYLLYCRNPDTYNLGFEYKALSALISGEKYTPPQTKETNDYREHLQGLPSEEINILYNEQIARYEREKLEKERIAQETREKRLFYNQPNAIPDFNHWSRIATCLLNTGNIECSFFDSHDGASLLISF